MDDVPILGVREPTDTPHPATGGEKPRPFECPLDSILDRVGKFGAAEREELDPVVGGLVVRGGDHYPEVGSDISDEKGGRRSGKDPRIEHVNSRAGESRRHRGREELPRDAGVASDDRAGLASLGSNLFRVAPLGQHLRRRLGEVQRGVGREVGIRQPTDAIGPEETRHRGRAD